MADADVVMVELVYAASPEHIRRWPLRLPAGSTVAQAVAASGLLAEFPELAGTVLSLGVFGKLVAEPEQQVLRAGDRVEVYRPLLIDPKEARRLRAEKAKAKRQT